MKPQSEFEFVWKQILFLLSLPILFFLMLFGKKKGSDLAKPLKELLHFIVEPKITFFLIITNIAVFLLEVFYLGQQQIQNLAFSPSDLFSFNLLPMVASWFLHASLAHLLGNMLFLFIFGRVVREVWSGRD